MIVVSRAHGRRVSGNWEWQGRPRQRAIDFLGDPDVASIALNGLIIPERKTSEEALMNSYADVG